MGNKLFVGGLSWNTGDAGLKSAFERFGEVSEAKVILDRETGRSRGFGFVTFADPSSTESAIQEMNGATLDGRSIRVNEAQERPRGAPRGPGGPGGPSGPDRGPPRAPGSPPRGALPARPPREFINARDPGGPPPRDFSGPPPADDRRGRGGRGEKGNGGRERPAGRGGPKDRGTRAPRGGGRTGRGGGSFDDSDDW